MENRTIKIGDNYKHTKEKTYSGIGRLNLSVEKHRKKQSAIWES